MTTTRISQLAAVLALVAVLLVPAVSEAKVRVSPPYGGRITTLWRYSTGRFHGAVDIAPGTCSSGLAADSVVEASVRVSVSIYTSRRVCYGNGSGHQNRATVYRGAGYYFRQWHFNKNGYSHSKTCNQCFIGSAGGTGNASGPHAHLQYDRYGSNVSGWYNLSKGRYYADSADIGWIR